MPNWERLREDFIITKRFTYLSNAAASPIPKPVYEKAKAFYDEVFNYGDTLWDDWVEEIERTRSLCAQFIGANSEEIGFTHSTSDVFENMKMNISDTASRFELGL